jgi:hypothetical protein
MVKHTHKATRLSTCCCPQWRVADIATHPQRHIHPNSCIRLCWHGKYVVEVIVSTGTTTVRDTYQYTSNRPKLTLVL